MNREIKFRAWDGERLRSVNTIGWTNGELDWLDTPKYHGPIDEDIKLMQHTGLKDKNGVEIYEGDVIEKEGHPSYYVSFKSGRFVAISTNSIQALNWEHRNLSDMLDLGFAYIGSIYENPELLEVTK